MSIIDKLDGLCAHCKNRFRRVFEPSNPEDFVDEEGNSIADIIEREGYITLDMCLLTDMPMGDDITKECSHFVTKAENNSMADYLK